MGKVLSMVANPFRNFNIESRAHKVISKTKPTVAPKHKTDLLDYERILKEYPQVIEESAKKHQDLDKHLRDVYVVAHDIKPEPDKSNPSRPLPSERKSQIDYEFGIKDPDVVPIGKITLRLALKFITDHTTDPKVHTVPKIAEQYALPEEIVKNILHYYRVFEVYIPQERKTKAKFAGPSIPRIEIKERTQKQLPKPRFKDET